MWPFKRKKGNLTPVVSKSILCIPGNWTDIEEFKDSLIVSTGAAYMVVGEILVAGKAQRHYSFAFCDRDERMKESFRIAGKVTGMPNDFLSQIEEHKYVIYIIGDTGNLEEAELMAKAGAAILDAGGTGIKVETAGKAFTKSAWLGLLANFEVHRLYDLFVLDSIIDVDGTVYSCGMHNLGLKDTIVSDEEFSFAVDLIRTFEYYQIIDRPVINNNQTFQMDASSPVYRITNEFHSPNEGHETFGNPFGMWRLTKMKQ